MRALHDQLKLTNAFLYQVRAYLTSPIYLDQCNQIIQANLKTLAENPIDPVKDLAHFLSKKYGHWGNHPHPDLDRTIWNDEAGANQTSLDYWSWVANQIQNYFDDSQFGDLDPDERDNT